MSTAMDGFLDRAGWGGAARGALAGDASARRYLRLERPDGSAVLMCAPPADRTAFDAFTAIAARLRTLGLSAPEVMATDPTAGLMLLEDLGARDFTALGPDQPEAVAALTDVLIHLARDSQGWDLPVLTPARLAEMTRIALPEGGAAALVEMERLFAGLFCDPPVPALRDVHAENLMWLPGRSGLARVGLLDFQDAVMAPAGYDLVSFIHDARRDTDPDLSRTATQAYAKALGLDPTRFDAQCAALSFQRNLRIMGVFRRLAGDRGKPGYLAHLPRVFGHVTQALTHPALADLARQMRPLLPEIAP